MAAAAAAACIAAAGPADAAAARGARPLRRRFVRFCGLVDDGAFERARAAFVELQPARDRLDAHLQVLHFDAGARRLDDEVVHQLVVQLVHRPARRLALRIALRVHRVQARLDVERLDQRVRIEQQLEQRHQQLANPPDRRPVRFEERRVLEREVRQLGRFVRRLRLAELIEEIGADAAGVEELLQLHRRKLADLLFGVVDAALLADPHADLLHDLLDVHRVGADVEIGHKQLSAFSVAQRPR